MHVESTATTDSNLASQYSVQGREKIFGLVNFWIQLNRKTMFEVKHVGAPLTQRIKNTSVPLCPKVGASIAIIKQQNVGAFKAGTTVEAVLPGCNLLK